MQPLKTKLIQLLIRFLAFLPLSLLQSLGAFFGRCAWLLKTRSSKYTAINLQACFPELNDQEREELGKNSLQETCKMMFEIGKSWILPPEETVDSVQSVRDEADMPKLFESGKGVLIIAPHLGNWEVMNIYLGKLYPINILYQPPNMEGLEDFITQGRAKVGTKVYPTDRKGVLAMFQALRKGEVVGILPDQEPPNEGGIMSPFFGNDALTMTLVSKLIQKTEARAVCAYAKRLDNAQGYEIIIKPAHEDIYSDDLHVSVAGLNKSIEEGVRENVEQYQWEYKRFRQGAEGKTRFYKDLD